MCITFEQLMECMVHKLTDLALHRSLINGMLGVHSDSILSYEAYAMFNVLFNVMQVSHE